MREHVRYGAFWLRHKWFVLIAGRRLGVPLWRLLVHDWSRLRPSEWRQYVRKHRTGAYRDDAIRAAILEHHHRNRHHWQYWVMHEDHGAVSVLPMPETYAREMVADWLGANRARTGSWDATEWYATQRDAIRLHPDTRRLVEALLHHACA